MTISKQYQADIWGRREIPEWLDRCETVDVFINRFTEVCASYEWKFMALQMAIVRWTAAGEQITAVANRFYPDRNLAQSYYPPSSQGDA